MPLQLVRDIARAFEAYKHRQQVREYIRQGYTRDNAEWMAKNKLYIDKALPVDKKNRGSRR